MRTITAGSTDNADGADVILKLLAARRGGGGIVFAEGSSRALGLPRHVASTGKQAGNGDIFVDVLPVEAGAAELDVRPSLSSTHIACSSNRTAVAEMLMPCPQD
jgi:hypothetical protein